MGKNNANFNGEKNPNYRHGFCKDKDKYTFYNTWLCMKKRCLNKNNPKYYRYGGRGIKICEEWLSIENFAKWSLNNGWKKNLTIDRIDNDGNYEPSNCRWVSVSENSRNKKSTKINFFQAENIRERLKNGEKEHSLAKEFNVVDGTIWFIKNNFTHVGEGECTKKLKNRLKI